MAVVDEMMKSVISGDILVRVLVFLLGPWRLECKQCGNQWQSVAKGLLDIRKHYDGWDMNTSADEYDFVDFIRGNALR